MPSLDPIYEAMAEQSFPFEGAIEYLPGEYQRFADPEKDRSNSNVFVYINPTGRWARFGNKASPDDPVFVRLNNGPLTFTERKRLAAYKRERVQVEQAARQRAHKIWAKCLDPDPYHPYLERKGVLPIYCRQHGQMLVTPVYNIDGELISLQFIPPYEGGLKIFLSGTYTAGGFMLIGDRVTKEIRLVEGYATGNTVHVATDDLTIVCYSAHNMVNVIQAIRPKFEQSNLIICCDRGQAGYASALRAARSVGRTTILAPLDPLDVRGGGLSDFNDLYMKYGMEAVEGQMCRHHFI